MPVPADLQWCPQCLRVGVEIDRLRNALVQALKKLGVELSDSESDEELVQKALNFDINKQHLFVDSWSDEDIPF
jgi:hypothetical protein